MNENKLLKKQLRHLQEVLRRKNQLLKQVRAARDYASKESSRVKCKLQILQLEKTKVEESLTETATELQSIKGEISSLKQYIECTESLQEKDDIVFLFDEQSKTYTKETQACVYELLSSNVTTSKVSPVIKSVLNLAGLQPNRLPCTSTVNNMNIQRLILCQKQLCEILPEKKNMCLLSDETSKFGKKIEGFHVSDESGQLFVLGVRQLVTKSGQDVMNVLQEILTDINDVSKTVESDISKTILLNIVSTMSDRAATQAKFNSLLEDFRTNVLSETMAEKWCALSEAEQLSISKLNNFFCGLHALVHIAETANECLKICEPILLDGKGPTSDMTVYRISESGTLRLVRTCCKAFSCGGDEKSGVYGPCSIFCKDYLSQHHMKSVPLGRFRGNRFNILFANAANCFFLHGQMKQFLEKEQTNRLLKSIFNDINTPVYVAGLKALGLVSFFITIPLWNLIENKNIHILDMCRHCIQLIDYLQAAMLDLHHFILGHFVLPFSESDFTNNAQFQSLLEPNEHDGKVIVVLEHLLAGICATLQKLFKDFLEGGRWSQCSTSVHEKTKSVPKSNLFCESVFGHIDRIMREKPNASLIAQESYIMFCHNKTMEWLNNKTDAEKYELLKDARHDVSKCRKLFQDRRKEIEFKRKEILQKKFLEIEEKERKRIEEIESYTNNIIEWGLWQTVSQVDNHLLMLKNDKDKISALKAQLKFRKNVLHQKPSSGNNEIFIFSKVVNGKRVPLSVQELSNNVKSLVEHAISLPETGNSGPVLVGQTIEMRFDCDGSLMWWKGFVISKVHYHLEHGCWKANVTLKKNH